MIFIEVTRRYSYDVLGAVEILYYVNVDGLNNR